MAITTSSSTIVKPGARLGCPRTTRYVDITTTLHSRATQRGLRPQLCVPKLRNQRTAPAARPHRDPQLIIANVLASVHFAVQQSSRKGKDRDPIRCIGRTGAFSARTPAPTRLRLPANPVLDQTHPHQQFRRLGPPTATDQRRAGALGPFPPVADRTLPDPPQVVLQPLVWPFHGTFPSDRVDLERPVRGGGRAQYSVLSTQYSVLSTQYSVPRRPAHMNSTSSRRLKEPRSAAVGRPSWVATAESLKNGRWPNGERQIAI